ncbi:MAG: hypothetical protein WD178_09500 [Actinomycetota bacterium]
MNKSIERSPQEYARRTGVSGIAAGVLIFIGAVGDIVVSAQTADGTITNRPLFALYVGAFIAGFGLLARALLGLKTMHDSSGERLPRSGRVGTKVSVAGAALIAASGAGTLVTGLVRGIPAEGSFVLFGLGMLLIIGGHIALSLGLRRAGVLRSWWALPLVAAVSALVAVGVPLDPWHDLGMVAFEAAWIVFGAQLVRRASRTAPGRSYRDRQVSHSAS